MSRHIFTAALAFCAASVAVRGFAQQASDIQALEQRFKQLDKNGDGRITTDEVPDSPFFKQRDRNGDGVITLAEAKAALADGAGPAPAAAPATKGNPSPPPAAKSTAKPTRASVRQSPQPLKASDHGVGLLIPDISLTDVAGASHKLSSLADKHAIVIAMTSTSCPLSRKYLPTLTNLAASYSQRGVAWLLVNPMATDRATDIEAAAQSLAGQAIYVRDQDAAVAHVVGATTTTDVIVLDSARTVVFHGAIDDQYGFGYSLDAPRNNYLADALDALLSGKHPHIAATDAPGCKLDLGLKSSPIIAQTYHNRISRIVQRNCVECHRDGGVGPFSLAKYEDVAAHSAMIKQVVEQGTMPPWFAAAEASAESNQAPLWANERRLAVAEKSDLMAWIDGSKHAGDERDAPRAVSFSDGWLIGKPDAVFEFAEPVQVKASGVIPYQNVVIETNLDEDKWVQAIEVQPGDRRVVHHMMIYLQSIEKERTTAQEEAADERAGFWAIYVPGNSTLVYPGGFARPLPKGANLRCQVHYTTMGEATTDRSRIGVIYAKQPPQHEVFVVGIGNPKIAIPPGAANHREEGSLRLPFDIEVLSFLPHMHLRAKACRYRVATASGETRTLLDIPRYDFNWQLLYRYVQPQRLSRGDTIKFTSWYDNSANNPANPDPMQTVRWGKQSTDEMHLGYVEYYVPGLAPGQPLPTGEPR